MAMYVAHDGVVDPADPRLAVPRVDGPRGVLHLLGAVYAGAAHPHRGLQQHVRPERSRTHQVSHGGREGSRTSSGGGGGGSRRSRLNFSN